MKILIHIGYGKSATTWMQNRLFPSLKEINYLGKTADSFPEWLIEWSYLDDFQFDKKKNELKDIILAQCHPDLLNVISSEAFSRGGGVSLNQASRVRKIFPNAHILIVVRDPVEAILSFYKNHIQEQGFFLPFKDCIDFHRTPMVFYKRKPIFLPDYFYDETLEAWTRFFDESQILLLRYENFCNDSDHFFEDLFSFMRIKAGVSKHVLKIRDNNSQKNDGELNAMRLRNLKKSMGHYLLSEESVKVEDEPINEATIDKLKKHLAGKCLNYY